MPRFAKLKQARCNYALFSYKITYIRDGEPPYLTGIRHKGYREAVDSL